MKMSIENRARLAFATVILLGATAVLTWYALTSSRYATYQIRTGDSVSGLIADAPVEFHGVEVGKVKYVALTDPHTVSILLSINKEVPITAATIATITSRGLATRGFTGYVYVSLEDSGTDPTPLAAPPGGGFPAIRTAPSRSVNLDTAISQVNENVQAVTDLLRSTLDKQTIGSLKQAVGNLQQVTAMLETNNRKLSAIISNTEQASNQFQPLLESGNDTIKTLQQQILPEAYKTLANLDRLSNALNGLTARINRDPSLLLRGTVQPPGPGETK
jgi:phospholipid/cholesterol/gamma-HCH transport system substrate-binding protein